MSLFIRNNFFFLFNLSSSFYHNLDFHLHIIIDDEKTMYIPKQYYKSSVVGQKPNKCLNIRDKSFTRYNAEIVAMSLSTLSVTLIYMYVKCIT